jgi:hypothetical protein
MVAYSALGHGPVGRVICGDVDAVGTVVGGNVGGDDSAVCGVVDATIGGEEGSGAPLL